MKNVISKGKAQGRLSGQAMVEYVIILPVMLMLILAIVQFGLIYRAKTTLNYATFQAVRAGTLNNASLSDMELSFASNMAPMYTTGYTSINSSGDCESSFQVPTIGVDTNTGQVLDSGERVARLGSRGGTGSRTITQGAAAIRPVLDANLNNFNSDNVICGRRVVQQQITDGLVQITVVNPSAGSFNNFGVSDSHDIDGNGTMGTVTLIPNDNLMYRDPKVISSGATGQSIQDANLLKIHVGYCYELVIPFIGQMIWAMQRYGPGNAPPAEANRGQFWRDPATTPPGFFGPPTDPFARNCIITAGNSGRRSISLYSQAIMRMQSAPVQCETTDSCTLGP